MSSIPKSRDDDPEDVSWALSTAATSFARGDRAEALKWLRRAAEAASEADNDNRALELAKAAADLSVATTPAPAAAAAPPPTPPTPAPATTPKAPATAPATKPAPRLEQPRTRVVSSLAATRKMTAKDTKLPPTTKGKAKTLPPSEERTDTNIVTEVTKLDTKPPAAAVSASEADGWPTEAMGASDLDSLHEVYGTERTRIGSVPYKPEEPDAPSFRASQAVRVVVWRDGEGELRIAPFGTRVSAVTIEALLVAPGPDVDLLAWLSPA